MSSTFTRRLVAGVGAGALAASFATTIGVGAAGAESVSATDSARSQDGPFNKQDLVYTRTVSDSTPSYGESITITNRLQGRVVAGIAPISVYVQTSGSAYAYEDHHPTCLEYVPDSVTLSVPGKGMTSVTNPAVVDPRVTKLDSGGWSMTPDKVVEWTAEYIVRCAPGQVATGGVSFHHTGGLIANTVDTDLGPTITVEKAASSTTLAPVGSAQVGEPTILAATVTAGSAGDAVDFYSGSTKIGSSTLDSEGKAEFDWIPTTKGTQSITAKYLGNSNVAKSTSAAQTVQVAAQNIGSITSLSVPASGQVGTAVQLSAAVSPAAAGGEVTFKNGSETIADVPVGADGRAEYSWTPATTGTANITAVFSGRDGVSGSTSDASTITIGPAPVEAQESTTTIDNVDGAEVGATSALRVVVTVAGADATTGTVTFKDGATVIGTTAVTDGVATLQWTPATAGQRTITAEYNSGTGSVRSSSNSTSVQVAMATGGGTPGDGGNGAASGSFDLSALFGSLGSLGK